MACTSGGTDTSTILGCIQEVCKQAQELVTKLIKAQKSADDLASELDENGQALKCVINGPADTYCTLPEGSVLPTLAEALQNLNACQITDIEGDSFVATGGQTVFTLGGAPANDYMIEVTLDGALCRTPADFIVAGTTLTFTHGLTTGDVVDTRRFIV